MNNYIERESRIKLDAVHSTLQEVLNGNVDKALVEESLAIVEELRDKRINQPKILQNQRT